MPERVGRTLLGEVGRLVDAPGTPPIASTLAGSEPVDSRRASLGPTRTQTPGSSSIDSSPISSVARPESTV